MAGLDGILQQAFAANAQTGANMKAGEDVGAHIVSTIMDNDAKLYAANAQLQAKREQIKQQYASKGLEVMKYATDDKTPSTARRKAIDSADKMLQMAGWQPMSEDYKTLFNSNPEFASAQADAIRTTLDLANHPDDPELKEKYTENVKKMSAMSISDLLPLTKRLQDSTKVMVQAIAKKGTSPKDEILKQQITGTQSKLQSVVDEAGKYNKPLSPGLSSEIRDAVANTPDNFTPEYAKKLTDLHMRAATEIAGSKAKYEDTEKMDQAKKEVISKLQGLADTPGYYGKLAGDYIKQAQGTTDWETVKLTQGYAAKLAQVKKDLENERTDETAMGHMTDVLRTQIQKERKDFDEIHSTVQKVGEITSSGRVSDLQAVLGLLGRLDGQKGRIPQAEEARQSVVSSLNILKQRFEEYGGRKGAVLLTGEEKDILHKRMKAYDDVARTHFVNSVGGFRSDYRAAAEGSGNRLYKKFAGDDNSIAAKMTGQILKEYGSVPKDKARSMSDADIAKHINESADKQGVSRPRPEKLKAIIKKLRKEHNLPTSEE